MARTVNLKSTRNISTAVLLSLTVHAVVVGVIWAIKYDQPPEDPPQNVVMVDIVPPPEPLLAEKSPEPAPSGPPAATPTPSQAAKTEAAAKAPQVTPKPQTAPPPPVHRTPPPVMPTEVVHVASGPAVPDMRLLGEGELAGALVAGSGAGGGAGDGGSGGGGDGGSGSGGRCDMAGRLQALVRRDSRIQSAVRHAQASLGAGRRAMQIWDGDWVQSQGQEGRGLAGVRQAIAVEVAFAPRECRQQRVNGLVVLSLGDDAGAPRLALGAPSWQWSELALR